MMDFLEWLAWAFNGTKVGKKLWKMRDHMWERRTRNWRDKKWRRP